jgi:DNA-binding response OmpR family regulator
VTSNQYIAFGAFRLDPVNECLWRDERAIALAPKEFAVLLHLVRHPGRMVTKVELFEVAVEPPAITGYFRPRSLTQVSA